MFAYKRTPYLGLLLGFVIEALTVYFFQESASPFSIFQLVLLYFFSFMPGLGIAMLLDPAPRKLKKKYLKINFYAETEEDRYRNKEERCN